MNPTAAHRPVGRGDLLRVLHAARQDAAADDLGVLLGFERRESLRVVDLPAIHSKGKPTTSLPADLPSQRPKVPMLGAASVPAQPFDAPVPALPTDSTALSPLEAQDWRGAAGTAPERIAMPPIVPRGRVLPAVERSMRIGRPAGLDIGRWVDALSRREVPSMRSRRQVQRLAPRRIVVLDMEGGLANFRHDIAWLVQRMQRQFGGVDFQVRWLANSAQPLAGWFDATPSKASSATSSGGRNAPKPWEPLPPDACAILFSDLGLSAQADSSLPAAWTHWLAWVQGQGARVQVWSPVPLRAEGLDGPLRQLNVVHWSAASNLRPQPLGRGQSHHTPERMQLAQNILARLAFCGLIDPLLLRAMRTALGPAGLDAGLEQLAWSSPDLSRGAATRRMRPAALQAHRDAFAALPLAAQHQVQHVATGYYRQFSQPLEHMHTLGWSSRVQHLDDASRSQLAQASQFVERLALAPNASGPSRTEVVRFLHTWLHHADAQEQHHHGRLRSRLSAALVRLQQHSAVDAQIPAGLPHAALADQLAADAQLQKYWLVQDALSGQVLLSTASPVPGQSALLPQPLELASADLQLGPDAPRRWLDLRAGAQQALVHQVKLGTAVFRTRHQDILIAPVLRPRGVVAWHRDLNGLHLRGAALGRLALQAGPQDIRLLPQAQGDSTPGLRVEIQPVKQDHPSVSFGIDPAHGLFMHLEVNGVVQRLVWIQPGTFLMGSPKNEANRDSDEGPQHRVTITQGYWLADTPCTQALWLAVMGGKNPSHFHETADRKDRPVEQVNVQDVEKFLQALQARLPEGCEAVLPTEAEWECACRAGSTTAYWWGNEFDPVRANVNEAHKGTTAVKRYEPNPWGLYDMHGNVWEWCADGQQRKYSTKPVEDPHGQTGVDARVVRGGSWDNHPAFARAAFRFHWHHGIRYHNLGFRLALRSTGPGGAGLGQTGGLPLARPEGAPPLSSAYPAEE